MKLDEALRGIVKLALDTPPIIYFIKAHKRYDALVTTIFQRINDGQIIGVNALKTYMVRAGEREQCLS